MEVEARDFLIKVLPHALDQAVGVDNVLIGAQVTSKRLVAGKQVSIWC